MDPFFIDFLLRTLANFANKFISGNELNPEANIEIVKKSEEKKKFEKCLNDLGSLDTKD